MITYPAICFVGTKNIALYIFDASSEASFSMQGGWKCPARHVMIF